MRGASAKTGDVDAIWRLERVNGKGGDVFKLTCTDHRMPVAEPEIVLTRETSPRLRHKVEGAGWMAAADASQLALIAALDAAGLPASAGRERARQVAREQGIKISNDGISRAIKLRQDGENLSGARGQVLPELVLEPVPDRSGQGDPPDWHTPRSEAESTCPGQVADSSAPGPDGPVRPEEKGRRPLRTGTDLVPAGGS